MSIALVGDSGAGYRQEAAQQSLGHASASLEIASEKEWIETSELASASVPTRISRFGGIWLVPGSPYKNLQGVLAVIRSAREQGIPLLGTCGGFQHLILEFVRNVLGHADAVHAEYEPEGKQQALSRLSCSLVGRTQVVRFDAASRLAKIYGRTSSEEEFHCNYGLNPSFQSKLSSSALKIVAWDAENAARAVDLAAHPFFIGTLFIPQYSSRPEAPHPVVCSFLQAACGMHG